MPAVPCSLAEILFLTGNDPLIRGVGGVRRGPTWRNPEGTAVAFIGLDAEDRVRSFVVWGQPKEAADITIALADEIPEGVRVTVPRQAARLLPVSRRQDMSEWDFRATYEPPPKQPVEHRVRWLDEDAFADITALLKLTSPDSSAWPGDAKVRRWAGVYMADELVACLADTSRVEGIGHISAIATHPDVRGRRIGPSITAWATRQLLVEGNDVVALGVYADNEAGKRMYDRLGFTVNHPLTSWRHRVRGR